MKKSKNDIKKYDAAMRVDAVKETGIEWHSPKSAPIRLAGMAWFAQDGLYRRMPSRPKHPLPEGVNSLANHTAGVQAQFRTDSKRVIVKVKLAGPANMYHMPATGQCGFDCYVGTEGASPRYAKTIRYDHTLHAYESALFEMESSEMRNVIVNFPLYQGVEELSIGLDRGAQLLAPPPYATPGRVVCYGTSITHGGCASRPGMAYTNILSRRLDMEFINLGFSGSGRGEPEVAKTIAEIRNVACIVLDYEANSPSLESLMKTLPEFIRILRRSHRATPILVLSRPLFAADLFSATSRKSLDERREFQRGTVAQLRKRGDRRIFFMDGADLMGEDFEECTVDGVHPTDLGFMRMANALTPVLKKILRRGAALRGTRRK